MRGEGGRDILKCHYYTVIMRGVRHGNRASTLSLTECNPPPPPSPSQKNPGHAPEEEKEIAELSKKELTRSVQRLSQQNKNRMVMTYRYICFNKKRMNEWQRNHSMRSAV